MKKSRLLIVDDCAIVRDGLRSILRNCPELEVVGEASDGDEVAERVACWQPDVVLMDTQMPRVDGIKATRLLKEQHPEIKVLVLAVHPQHLDAAFAAGADACLLKDSSRQELVQATLNLLQG